MIKSYITLFLVIVSIALASSQNVYKTPYGRKYHLASCRMVENVSEKVDDQDIDRHNLAPCKICKPPVVSRLGIGSSTKDKSSGTSAASQQCRGVTQRSTRCKHMTKLANGYCYQHTTQHSRSQPSYRRSTSTPAYTTSSPCGARTKSGGSCKRKVKGGGRCYQH